MVIDDLERYFLIVVLEQFFDKITIQLFWRRNFRELRSLFTPDFLELGKIKKEYIYNVVTDLITYLIIMLNNI